MTTDYSQEFVRLYDILKELRKKCPWDKKQTIYSLSQNTIEELYELIDSIHNQDWQSMKEELGDLMLHLLFYSLMAEENKEFSLYEVLHGICEKLIYRHPHIYSDTKVDNEDDVMKNWEKLKLKEGKKSVLEGVPLSLPAMVKATRMQEKVSRIGFDFPTIAEAFKKVKEEEQELQ
ncbi:MAG: MazG family protein, partial [Chitinophagaceae bacterium]